ncbi:hypothetical protein F5Y18DRAFT_432924 [Xylariaceae sp. FL1019]|nr:hypothetical protein F5Y18DRAFT_432924 [Xylariaceae sp. FL1019]
MSYFGVILNAVNWTLTILALLFLALRVYCKLARSRGLWWDDYLLIAAWISTLIGVALITSGITLGFADPNAVIGPEAARQLQIHGGVQQVVFSLASDLSKTSFGLTLIRVVSGKTKILIIVAMVLLNIIYFLTIIFTFFKCSPALYCWLPADTCWSLWTYIKFLIFAGAYSAAFDFLFALIPWFLVKDLQMRRAEKLGVAVAMSFGSIAGITAVIRTVNLPMLANPNFSSSATILVIWYVAEAATTIIAASIPVLRALIKDIKTSSNKYFKNKYGSGHLESGTGGTSQNNKRSRTQHSALHSSRVVTTVTGKRNNKKETDMYGDTSSDKSILEGHHGNHGNGHIVQTQEIRLSYHDRNDSDSNMGYEMEVMGQRQQK